jgi:D-alanyl-lipoteichoic acid acyltransferase DltB (MBOAT superfamily)
MLFSSNLFLLLFLPLVLLGYYQPLLKGRPFRNRFLLASSLVFYAWGEPVFVFIMCAGILVNWALALRMDKQTGGSRKRALGLAIGIDVLLLFVCKYTNFAMQNLGLLLGTDPFFIAPWGLPLGVSFYSFQIMSYVIDIYRGKAAPQKSLLDCALYISLFPQLVAGPIVRYDAIAAQIAGRKESWDDFVAGFTRFVVGLAKKLLIADQCAPLADAAFTQNADGMLEVPMA